MLSMQLQRVRHGLATEQLASELLKHICLFDSRFDFCKVATKTLYTTNLSTADLGSVDSKYNTKF